MGSATRKLPSFRESLSSSSSEDHVVVDTSRYRIRSNTLLRKVPSGPASVAENPDKFKMKSLVPPHRPHHHWRAKTRQDFKESSNHNQMLEVCRANRRSRPPCKHLYKYGVIFPEFSIRNRGLQDQTTIHPQKRGVARFGHTSQVLLGTRGERNTAKSPRSPQQLTSSSRSNFASGRVTFSSEI